MFDIYHILKNQIKSHLDISLLFHVFLQPLAIKIPYFTTFSLKILCFLKQFNSYFTFTVLEQKNKSLEANHTRSLKNTLKIVNYA